MPEAGGDVTRLLGQLCSGKQDYHKLTPMLLKELQRQNRHAQQQDETIRQQREQALQQQEQIRSLEARLAALEALLSGKASTATAGR